MLRWSEMLATKGATVSHKSLTSGHRGDFPEKEFRIAAAYWYVLAWIWLWSITIAYTKLGWFLLQSDQLF